MSIVDNKFIDKNKLARDATTEDLLENLQHLKIADLNKDQTFKFIAVRESSKAINLSKIAIVVSIVLPILLILLDRYLNQIS